MANNKKSKEEKDLKKFRKRNRNIENDLFDNPMVKNILKSMSPDEIQKYKQIGESLYGNVKFETNEVTNNIQPPMEESVAYIKEALKSGMLVEDLEDNEIKFLKDYYGDNWIEKLNLNKQDL